jgi:hypothetical protein
MSTTLDYRLDQELAAIPLHWQDRDGDTRDLSSGWTVTVRVTMAGDSQDLVLLKTTGITLSATNPNVLIEWSTADTTAIATALGTVPEHGKLTEAHVYARRDADSLDDKFPGRFNIRWLPAVATS